MQNNQNAWLKKTKLNLHFGKNHLNDEIMTKIM